MREKLSILFVDDEGRVLDGMRRALRRSGDRWSLWFVEGGMAALGAMAAHEHDVVISDMRMPGMDGAALLAEVARLHPSAVRVVLSGQTDVSAACRAAHVAHRFLAKPIEAPAVVALLEQVEGVRGLLTDPAIRSAVGSTNLVAWARDPEMAALCANPGMSPAEVVRLVRRSPVLLAKTLQLAGSAFFSQAYSGTSIEDVINHLGVGPLVGVVCDDLPCRCPGHGREPDDAWRERARVVAARAIEDPRVGVRTNDAFAAALLHDIGSRFVKDAADVNLAAAVSAYLLGLWGLPDAIVAAVRWQNEPAMAGDHHVLAGVVHAANRVATEASPGGDAV